VARVVVAADHPRIAEALRPFGTTVIMTSPDHTNGTSRLAEAARLLDLAPEQIVANVQGDEPEVDPGAIDAAVEALVSRGADMGTVASPITDPAELASPAVVKVVLALDSTALYFSRAAIPHDRDGQGIPAARPLRHVGLYTYRRRFLERYAALPQTALERAAQKLDMPHALEVFADRAYDDAMRLVPRSEPGSVIHDTETVAERVARMVCEGEIVSISGKRMKTRVDSVCVHGDTPGAVSLARAVRGRLEAEGVTVAPFAA